MTRTRLAVAEIALAALVLAGTLALPPISAHAAQRVSAPRADLLNWLTALSSQHSNGYGAGGATSGNGGNGGSAGAGGLVHAGSVVSSAHAVNIINAVLVRITQ